MATTDSYIKRFEKLRDKKYNFSDYYQETAEYFTPRKAYITKKTSQGERLKQDLFDTTGRKAINFFKAGMFASLTPASGRWLDYSINNEIIQNDKESQAWLNKASTRVLEIINGTNWSSEIQDAYSHLGLFGTASVLVERDPKKKLRFRSLPIEEIFIAENSRGEVDTMYREIEWTVHQVYSEWGDKSGKSVLEKVASGSLEDKVKILHVIEPRYEREAGTKASQEKPFKSIYINMDDKTEIKESGFDYFPTPTARLNKEKSSPYGYGIAMISLPDMKELNKFHYIVVRGGLKQVDPILFTNDDGIMLPKSLNSGDLIKGSGPTSDLKAIQTGGRHDIGKDLLLMKQDEIRESFFIDLFLSLARKSDQGAKTAFEVAKIVEENKAMIAPLIMPITNELLTPIAENIFFILLEDGEFGEIPQVIQDNAEVDPLTGEAVIDLNVKYMSSLARAQKLEELGEITDFLQFVGEIGQAQASVGAAVTAYDKADTDMAIDKFAKLRGVDPELVITTEDADELRAIKAQQAAQTQALAAGQAQADINKTSSEAERNAQTG